MLLMGSAERINTTYLEWVKETLFYEISYHLDKQCYLPSIDTWIFMNNVYSNTIYDRRGSLEFSLYDFL